MCDDLILKRADDAVRIVAIAAETIRAVYPKYYPAGAVQFFLDLHCEEHIREAMETEEIYLVLVGNTLIGTGSIRRNEICRLFILPEYQGSGYGSALMDRLEERILKDFDFVHVDASFPAERMYLKRGYRLTSYEMIETGNGDFLCYHVMEKGR